VTNVLEIHRWVVGRARFHPGASTWLVFTRSCALRGLFASLSMIAAMHASGQRIHGFIDEHSDREREVERRFMAVPNSARSEFEHRTLTKETHLSGSAGDRRTAKYLLDQFRSEGLDANIEEFRVLLSEPKRVSFELLTKPTFHGPTPERPARPQETKNANILIGFNAYSGSGDAEAEVVFANYGLRSDYEYLQSIGVSVRTKIVLVRRGDSEAFRGVKVKLAEEHGAAGVLIYSDPDDDGYHAGATYPEGPWRPATGVERGTVLYEFISPGDPKTPTGSSTVPVPCARLRDSNLFPGIPVLPLSYGDAKHILEVLRGSIAPRLWQGGLPLTYRTGPGPVKVHLHVAMNNVVKTIWIVVAKVRGTKDPDQIVVLGNHRDAWGYGGVDPGTGTVALLEMARGFGVLLRGGWRPRRSIWLCSWDAHEQGMIGSTRWAEQHTAQLQGAIAYLNLDVASSGGPQFSVGAVPSLQELLSDVAADVPDPNGGSILDSAIRAQSTKPGNKRLHVDSLGGGSDFVVFLDHLGIPSVDFGFGSEYGAYHSIFDDHHYVETFADPGFRYQVAAARYYGLLTLRLAQADLLPFNYGSYGREIQSQLAQILEQLGDMRHTDDIDVLPLQTAVQRLVVIGEHLHRDYEEALVNGVSDSALSKINWALANAEHGFLLPKGLPGRPWYRHAVFAPGTYSADAPLVFPGIQQCIADNDFECVRREVGSLTAAVDRVTHLLESP
jgi:N-acetylated-alpha-linked acidic dipeptidase